MVQSGLNHHARDVQRECLSLKADISRFKAEQSNHLSSLDDKVAKLDLLIGELVNSTNASGTVKKEGEKASPFPSPFAATSAKTAPSVDDVEEKMNMSDLP